MRAALRIACLLAALVMTAALAGPAVAAHKHYLQTPGTCVVDIASGQTSQAAGGGYHQFHENVHIGTAGTALASTPVSVGKSDTGTCP